MSVKRTAVTIGLALAGAVATVPGAAHAAPVSPAPPVSPFAAYETAACTSDGVTAADLALAADLNLSGYQVSCARAVVGAVRDRGLPVRAATIAITTTIVETNIRNISEEVDHDSLGLFQQRGSWGSRAQRLDPRWATNAFLDKMLRLYPDGAWQSGSIGAICQAVQVSAYPDRYQEVAAKGQQIAAALWQPVRAKFAPTLAYDQGDGSMRLYRWTSTGTGFARAADYDSGSFALSNVGDRVASGDVNGDGRTDVVMAYQNGDGTWALHAFDKGGAWSGVWYTGGQLNLDRVGGRLVVGDFNGDGKAEPALVYDNGDGTMKIFRWTSNGSSFVRAADYQSGSFALGNVGDRVVAADADGDGKDDILMAYQKSDGTWEIHDFRYGSSWSGVWYTGGSLNLDKVAGRFTAGDYNGDGKAEPALVYDNGDGTMKIFRWTSNGSSFVRAADYESGSFDLGNVDDRVASGDANGDGRSDIVMAYQNADGTWAAHVFAGGSGWSGAWYTGGSLNLDRVAGRLVLGGW